MRIKVSEKHVLAGICFLLISLAIFANTELLASPVKISEKGLLAMAVAMGAFLLSVKLIRSSLHKIE
ncbi:MAG TPA: hypothetical protein VMZ03_07975 [Chitinophagaceae bacterium]|nr:hypothetical protein [Chitinophagaceae bacterium]